KLEVIVDPGMVVVQVFVVDYRPFHRGFHGREAVRLGDERVGITVPRQVISEEDSRSAGAPEFFIRGIGIRDEMLPLDAFHALHVRDPHAQQSPELFQPASRQGIAFAGRGRSAVFILRVLAPNEKRNFALNGLADGDSEDPRMLGPRDVAYLRQADPVQLPADYGIRGNLDVIDAHILDVVDVPPADFREMAGRGRNAKRIHSELQHADDLVGAVLASAYGNNAIVIAAVGRTIAVEHGLQLRPTRGPSDLFPVFIA